MVGISNAQKHFLAANLRSTGAFLTGDFTLASGRKSNVYLDCRMLTLDRVGLEYAVSLVSDVMDKAGLRPNRVGGDRHRGQGRG